MKIQINTDLKTITIESNVNLKEFYDQIQLMLPSGSWEQFTLVQSLISNWSQPIYIPYQKPPCNPWTDPVWYQQLPYVTCDTNTGTGSASSGINVTSNFNLKSGIYNVELGGNN